MMRGWTRLPLYPFLLPLTPILTFWSDNRDSLAAMDLVGPSLLCLFATALLLPLGRVVFGGWAKSGAILGVSYLHLFYWEVVPWESARLVFIAGLMLASVGLIPLARESFRKVTPAANVLALGLLFIPAFTAARDTDPWASPDFFTLRERPGATSLANDARAEPPDIFVILLDGYARADVLERYYGFDNSEFLDQLEGQGFYVVDGSYASYFQSRLTLSSLAHVSYLHDVLDEVRKPPKENAFRWLINKGVLWELLRNAGYRIVTVRAEMGYMDVAAAEVVVNSSFALNEFSSRLLDRLSVVQLAKSVGFAALGDVAFERHRNRVERGLADLASLRVEDRPSFVYAHFLSPHPPFVFGSGDVVSDCNADFGFADGRYWRVLNRRGGEHYRECYVDQLRILNGLVLDAIGEILADRERPVAIFLFSDHGPGSMLDLQSLEKSNLVERMANLQVQLWPSDGYRTLRENIGLLNGFRALLNEQIGSRFEPLPDRSYFSSWSLPLQFVDVSDRLPGRED